MKLVKIILVMLLPVWVFAQDPPYPSAPPAAANINAAEYFLDVDPGYGNGTPISITSPGLDLTFSTIPIDISSLSAGVHNVFIRTRNTDGEWSQTSSKTFVVEPDYPVAPPAASNITDAEYFFDTDPGLGNGIPITITNAIDVTLNNVSLDLTGLSSGVHRAFLRTKDANGNWSQTSNKTILI